MTHHDQTPAAADRMDAFDQLLHRGEANPRTRSGVMSVEILDRAPDWERFMGCYERVSRTALRLRQKVVMPVMPTTAPRWVVDPDFDLNYHVRRVAVAEPGTTRALLDFADTAMQSPMDISRPLWTVTLVEGLTYGRAAVLSHMSHAVTDGVGGLEMVAQLYDDERDPPPRALAPLPIPQNLSAGELTITGLNQLPAGVLSTARGAASGAAATVGQIIRDPVGALGGALEYLRSGTRVMAPAAETSPLLRRRGRATRTEAVDIDFDALRAAAKAAGGSLNDAYLAGLCGALGRYHERLGVPVSTLPMAVPVSVRSDDDPAGGNRFTGVTLAAPIGQTDPGERIRAIRAQMLSRREEPALGLFGAVAPALSLLPQPLIEAVTEAVATPDVQASNVPGYPGDTYLAGAKVLRQYGLGPLPGVAMMVVMVSRAGLCTLTARYDLASVTDPTLFENCLREGFDEVLALAGRSAPRVVAASASDLSADSDPSGPA
jgi:diacylglycerol O-acyltransferase / wax synthase